MREDRLVSLVYLVCLVYLVEPARLDRPDEPSPVPPVSRQRERFSGWKDGMGNLVVLLLAERAPSEGPRSTRAIEDQPGHLLEKQTSKLGGTIVR